MAALGIDMTDRDEPTTWSNLHTSHPENILKARALELWRLAGQLGDEENPDWVRIHNLQEEAQLLERVSREDWYNEATAMERDHQEQMKDERP